MKSSVMARVVQGDSASMTEIGDGEADLVICSPPYFSRATEPALSVKLRAQTDYERIVEEVTGYALSFRANFEEMYRVLKSSGFMVVQTRHVRYGDFLAPLADLHCEIALNCGFRLVSKVEWLPVNVRPSRVPQFVSAPAVGRFRALDTEVYFILVKGRIGHGEPLLEGLDSEPDELVQPLWRTHAASGGHHPHAAPPEMIRRFIKLYSHPGDLVVDPFCGSGTTLLAARELGRNSIGYEIDPHYAEVARGRLE